MKIRARCGTISVICASAVATLAIPAATSFGGNPLSMPDRAAAADVNHTFIPNGAEILASWMSAGGAVADFNGNGLPDIFVFDGGNNPDRLYINQGDGSFEDQAVAWGLTTIHSGNGAAAADYNNDGNIDLYVTSFGNLGDMGGAPNRNKLYQNNGDQTFTNVAEEAGVEWVHDIPCGFGACWGDYNLNGHLDLFVTTWWNNSPMRDTLYRNNGDGTFTDVTVAARVNSPLTYGFQGSFVDMDGDGWPELLISGDFFTSQYYRNDGDGTFTNITQASGTGQDSNGMGQAVADVNNDALLDWYVTSVWPAGQNPGNMLYINQGNHSFVEVGQDAGVHDGAWGWGTIAVDLDHDGRVELIEVNGRQAAPWHNVPPRLFYNNGDGTFTDIAVASGMTHPDQGRAVARLDVERDGRQDILTINLGQPVRYYRNETETIGNWIVIDFDTSTNPFLAPNGFGTHVTVQAGEETYVRHLNGQPSYLATSELNVHFGLADVEIIDTLTIHWPRGYVTTMTNVPVNQYLTATAPTTADLNADGVVNVADLLLLLANWGTVQSAHDLKADQNNDGTVNVADLLLLLASWG